MSRRVAGLVTNEDLVEEIVVRSATSMRSLRSSAKGAFYIVFRRNGRGPPGGTLWGEAGGEGVVDPGGLVTELAGRIPQKGEVIEQDGLRFE